MDQPLIIAHEDQVFDDAISYDLDFDEFERFGQVTERAASNGFDGSFDRGIAGHDDDIAQRIELFGGFENFQAIRSGWHDEVRKDNVECLFSGLEKGDGLGAVTSREDREIEGLQVLA